MSAINRMLSLYNSVEETHIFHVILSVILQNLQQVPNQSIEELAASCFTAPSSISRVVRSLGYRNFTEFKYALGAQLKNYGFENRLYPIKQDSRQHPCEEYLQSAAETVAYFQNSVDIAQIQHASALLNQANSVHILYSGEGRANIHPLQCELFTAGKDVSFSSKPAALEAKLGEMGPGCLVLIVLESNNEDYGGVAALLPAIHNAGSRLLLIASDVNPLFDQVEAYTLRYPRDMTLNSFLYCYIYLNLLTIDFRDRYIDQKKL